MNREEKISTLKNIFSGRVNIKSITEIEPFSSPKMEFKRVSPIRREELRDELFEDSSLDTKTVDVYPFELFKNIETDKIYTYQEIFSLYKKDERSIFFHSLSDHDEYTGVGITDLTIWFYADLGRKIEETLTMPEKELLGLMLMEMNFSEDHRDILMEPYSNSTELFKRLKSVV